MQSALVGWNIHNVDNLCRKRYFIWLDVLLCKKERLWLVTLAEEINGFNMWVRFFKLRFHATGADIEVDDVVQLM